MQRLSGGWALLNFALVEAPPLEKQRDLATLTEHFKAIVGALGNPKTKTLVAAIGVEESVLKQIFGTPEPARQEDPKFSR